MGFCKKLASLALALAALSIATPFVTANPHGGGHGGGYRGGYYGGYRGGYYGPYYGGGYYGPYYGGGYYGYPAASVVILPAPVLIPAQPVIVPAQPGFPPGMVPVQPDRRGQVPANFPARLRVAPVPEPEILPVPR
jgi:hypothetical protein